LHVASTDTLTHADVHATRGQEAMEAAGMLGSCTGTAGHDHWKPSFKYHAGRPALWNAHHLRERQYSEQQDGQSWANDMTERLLEMQAAVEETRPQAPSVPPQWLEAFERREETIIQEGLDAHRLVPPPNEGPRRKRGRPTQTPPRNLLLRLRDFQGQVLAFLYDFAVPFDHNQAERDVRMVQVKQQVSGGFRTLEGTQRFGRIRGSISTARQHTKNVFEAIRDAFDGTPLFLPQQCRKAADCIGTFNLPG
jgi:transposase